MTFYEPNPEVRPTGQEPAEFAEIPDPPPPPLPDDGSADAIPAVEGGELARGSTDLPSRGRLLTGLALAVFGALLLVAVRSVRSRRP